MLQKILFFCLAVLCIGENVSDAAPLTALSNIIDGAWNVLNPARHLEALDTAAQAGIAKYSDGMNKATSELGTQLQTAFSGVQDFAEQAFASVAALASSILNPSSTSAEYTTVTAGESESAAGSETASQLAATGTNMLEQFATVGSDVASQLVGTGSDIAEQAVSTGLNMASELANTGTDIAGQFVSTGLNMASELANTGTDIAEQFTTSGSNMATQLAGIGSGTATQSTSAGTDLTLQSEAAETNVASEFRNSGPYSPGRFTSSSRG